MSTLPTDQSTKPAHTPWTTGGIFDPNGPDPRTNIWGRRPRGAQSGEIIAHDVRLHDAEFICRACNAHDALVAALRLSLNWLASYPGGGATHAWEQVRAVLAKAEGQ